MAVILRVRAVRSDQDLDLMNKNFFGPGREPGKMEISNKDPTRTRAGPGLTRRTLVDGNIGETISEKSNSQHFHCNVFISFQPFEFHIESLDLFETLIYCWG